jgi:alpha-L-fucosidase
MADENEKMPDQISMNSFSLPENARLSIVGTGASLKWQKNKNGFVINIPEKIRKSPPSKYVWVVKASY